MNIWIKAALIRAVRTLAQTAVATIGTTAMLTEVNWVAVASIAGLAACLSILTSVAGLPEAKTPAQGDETWAEDWRR